MLAAFRAFAKSPVAAVLFGLLLVSFAVFGISDVFRGGTVSDAVIQAGSRSIGAAAVQARFDTYLKAARRSRTGQPVTTEEAVGQRRRPPAAGGAGLPRILRRA